ncbi:uncharacterized protein [Euphorbia lathyris]|uniref:uncharacterized protein n=1 Tax=Euphorbia lathyris TaxID=212925 RepID=UPI003313BBD4
MRIRKLFNMWSIVSGRCTLSPSMTAGMRAKSKAVPRCKMKHIINNLTMCIGNRVGETTLLPGSRHPYASNCLRKSADLQKCSIVDLQATKGKAKKVPHNFQPKNEQEDLFH